MGLEYLSDTCRIIDSCQRIRGSPEYHEKPSISKTAWTVHTLTSVTLVAVSFIPPRLPALVLPFPSLPYKKHLNCLVSSRKENLRSSFACINPSGGGPFYSRHTRWGTHCRGEYVRKLVRVRNKEDWGHPHLSLSGLISSLSFPLPPLHQPSSPSAPSAADWPWVRGVVNSLTEERAELGGQPVMLS